MAKPATASNNFDAEQVNSFLAKIDGYEVDILSERGASMKRCRNIRESISNVYKEAKAAGVPNKELRALVRIRKHEAASRKLYDELEPDQQQTVAMLAALEKVRDLPLWRFAAEESAPAVTAEAEAEEFDNTGGRTFKQLHS